MARYDQKDEVLRIGQRLFVGFLVFISLYRAEARLVVESASALIERSSGKGTPCLIWQNQNLRAEQIENRNRRTYVTLVFPVRETLAGCSQRIKSLDRMTKVPGKLEYRFLVEAPSDSVQLINGGVRERISFEVRLEDSGDARIRKVAREMTIGGEIKSTHYAMSTGTDYYLPSMSLLARFPSLFMQSAQIRVALGTSLFRLTEETPFVSDVSAGVQFFPWVLGSKNTNSFSLFLGYFGQDFHSGTDEDYSPSILSRRAFELGSELRFSLSRRGRLGMNLTGVGHLLKAGAALQYDWMAGGGLIFFGRAGRMIEIFGNYTRSQTEISGENATDTDTMWSAGLRLLFQPALFGE